MIYFTDLKSVPKISKNTTELIQKQKADDFIMFLQVAGAVERDPTLWIQFIRLIDLIAQRHQTQLVFTWRIEIPVTSALSWPWPNKFRSRKLSGDVDLWACSTACDFFWHQQICPLSGVSFFIASQAFGLIGHLVSQLQLPLLHVQDRHRGGTVEVVQPAVQPEVHGEDVGRVPTVRNAEAVRPSLTHGQTPDQICFRKFRTT